MSDPIGMSLHIGVDRLDPACYPLKPPHPDYPDGWDGPLKGCEKDARDMFAIATAQNFDAKMLLTTDATSDAVESAIKEAAAKLSSGDMFFLSYAGHGGQVLDRSGDEEDKEDETWCLYDRHFLDDELYSLYADFKPGVRILVLSDSCHSGTVMRGGPVVKERPVRSMPRGSVYQIYKAREPFYNDIQDRVAKEGPKAVKASILLLAACQDDQEADGGEDNGAFTAALRKVWNNGEFSGTYTEFHAAIRDELQRRFEEKAAKRGSVESADEEYAQDPNIDFDGPDHPTFGGQKPFSI